MDEEEYEALRADVLKKRKELMEMGEFPDNLRNRMRMTALMHDVLLVSYEDTVGRAKLEYVLDIEFGVLLTEIERLAELN